MLFRREYEKLKNAGSTLRCARIEWDSESFTILTRICLLQCCANDNLSLAEVLLSYNVDINCRDDNGSTPLHLACGFDHPELVQLLLVVSGKDFLLLQPFHDLELSH